MKHQVSAANAPLFLQWFRERGGVLHWTSIDLSDMDWSVFTPALDPEGKPAPKPSWKANPEPQTVDLDDVFVIVPVEVRRFRVAIRLGSNGLGFKLTDAATRKLRQAVATAKNKHKAAWYEFDYSTQEAVIFASDAEVPLKGWKGDEYENPTQPTT